MARALYRKTYSRSKDRANGEKPSAAATGLARPASIAGIRYPQFPLAERIKENEGAPVRTVRPAALT